MSTAPLGFASDAVPPFRGPSVSTNRHVRGLPSWDRAAVVGVVNVTPDSFSDGGEYYVAEDAVRHGIELMEAGADLIDVGGESTRPGAPRVDAEEELRRVLPVIRELAAAGALVSVDTMRAEVAERALDAGARLINDVSGGLADPAMVPFVADAAVPYIVVHWRGHSAGMNKLAIYDDVVGEVVAQLCARVERVVDSGVDPERVIIDPGLGFAKHAPHDWALLRRIDAVLALGRPVLIGASRKRFVQRLLAEPDGTPRPPSGCDAAATALSALLAVAGVWAVRVHAAAASVDAVRVARMLEARQ